ncbi:MAG: DUF58 domain-containing protein [Ruminococcus sp.]|nr:DUF58 domain-containing protein [Ruminococcus sp.]
MAVTALPVLSLALMFINRRIKLELSVPDYAVINGKTYITISIRNRTIIPIISLNVNTIYRLYELENKTESESTITFSVPSLSMRQVIIEQNYDKYVFEQIQVKEIVIYDLLGIFHTKIKCNECSDLSVIPNISSDENASIKSSALRENGEINVREYRTGDPLSHIHHKLSSKSEVIYTRVYDDEIYRPLLVLNISENGVQNCDMEEYAKKAYTLLSDIYEVEMINLGFDKKTTIISDIDSLQKHLVNAIKMVNTQKYNEYISQFDYKNYSVIYYFPEN